MSTAPENLTYENSDARVPQVLAGVAILVAGIAFSLVVAALVYRGRAFPPSPEAATMSFRHGDENKSTIVRDWREQDERVREHLESYAWLDREKGFVRIPIERAMDLMGRDEEPVRKKP